MPLTTPHHATAQPWHEVAGNRPLTGVCLPQLSQVHTVLCSWQTPPFFVPPETDQVGRTGARAHRHTTPHHLTSDHLCRTRTSTSTSTSVPCRHLASILALSSPSILGTQIHLNCSFLPGVPSSSDFYVSRSEIRLGWHLPLIVGLAGFDRFCNSLCSCRRLPCLFR